MKGVEPALSLFHPIADHWFKKTLGPPSRVQTLAWPLIAQGKHVLACAPTGSGKTLAAFLFAINSLATGQWPMEETSVLYISPLKALNRDIRKNLLGPLAGLKHAFEGDGVDFPPIRVETRSGDTPASQRRAMLRHPPEILATTPESLHILLSSASGQDALKGIKTVIMDEIHSVIPNRRGTLLACSIERLAHLYGEFQRVVLSATVRPPDMVARFAGGFRLVEQNLSFEYRPRNISVVSVPAPLDLGFEIKSYPGQTGDSIPDGSAWDFLANTIREMIQKVRSTLVFTNSRKLCEKLTLKINEGAHGDTGLLAYAHHGSLSHDLRRAVENRLKKGELKAVVATASLELGIDVGELDQVILVQTPFSISSALQRIGRSGHQVGGKSLGALFATHEHDLLEAAVLTPCLVAGDIEKIQPMNSPLDVLAQVVVSMSLTGNWTADDLYKRIKTVFAFHDLKRPLFDSVVKMLAGHYGTGRLRELSPRITFDPETGRIFPRKNARLALYFSGGVIADRGCFTLRRSDTGSKVGELDEEFVWEARLGQVFAFGTANWRIDRITANEVFVLPANPGAASAPFWKGEEFGRDFYFSEKIAFFLMDANERLENPEFAHHLETRHLLDPTCADRLAAYLKRQKKATRTALPHRRHILVEHTKKGPGDVHGHQVILHNFWGGKVNRPYAMALEAGWSNRFGHRPRVYGANDCVVVVSPAGVDSAEILSLVTRNNLMDLLRQSLEGSGIFGAKFRECAGRALLLHRAGFGRRTPLWMTRLRSKTLLDAVSSYQDFPILLETWRTCLEDEFDMRALRTLLGELEDGILAWSEARTQSPSPFARTSAWRQINTYMYEDDASPGNRTPSADSLLLKVMFDDRLRPEIPRQTAMAFEEKRHRVYPGYAPSDGPELLAWVAERLAVPMPEWRRLLSSIKKNGQNPEELAAEIQSRLAFLPLPDGSGEVVTEKNAAERLNTLFFPKPAKQADLISMADSGEDLVSEATLALGQWLSYYGPVSKDRIRNKLGLNNVYLDKILALLEESKTIVTGRLTDGGIDWEACDAKNYEILLRMVRRDAIPRVASRPIDQLPGYLAQTQGLIRPESMGNSLDRLFCLPVSPELLESDYLPPRYPGYDAMELSTLFAEHHLLWIGMGTGRVALCPEPDLDLLLADTPPDPAPSETGIHFPDPMGRYPFSTLLQITGLGPEDLIRRLWEAVFSSKAANDSLETLRRGVAAGFKAPKAAATSAPRFSTGRRFRRSRPGFSTWTSAVVFPGNWFALPDFSENNDPIEAEERSKDRVRLLLRRYGILFRELVEREAHAFRWSRIFKAVRLMELSGELVSGVFFENIPGPQFMDARNLARFKQGGPENHIFWINAADPASACGLAIGPLKKILPPRRPTTHLVFNGFKPAMISTGNGRHLTFLAEPEESLDLRYLEVLHHLLVRKVNPLKKITVHTINKKPADQSPHLPAFQSRFDAHVEESRLVLYLKQEDL